tara:strand:- start:626 stop:772 length:147 start_codon:yes stop_codon:yes gene_type:complete
MKTDKEIEERYLLLAECIRSDQLSAKQVVTEFNEDPRFASWYKNKYNK